jgi:hypothetical protein
MQLNATIDGLLAQNSAQDLFALVLERQRKLAHDKDKAIQPAAGVKLDAAAWATITAFARRPIETAEEGQGGLDNLSVTVQDCITAKDADDLIFALLRCWRKCYHLQPHLGSIGPQ